MPVGIIMNSSAIFIGGIVGALVKDKLGQRLKDNINMVFGVCSMGMGVSTIVLMENMPAVIFSLIAGTVLGLMVRLGERINRAGELMQKGVSKLMKTSGTGISQEEFTATMVTVIVLFCASGTGIYGSIVSGMTGDHSILIAKSILDLPTALIFGCSLGMVVSLIAVPQAAVFLLLFFCARLIFPLTTPAMLNDFKAVGGFIMLATGFRIIKVRMFPTADMIPAMIIVMPISWLWSGYVLPLLG